MRTFRNAIVAALAAVFATLFAAGFVTRTAREPEIVRHVRSD